MRRFPFFRLAVTGLVLGMAGCNRAPSGDPDVRVSVISPALAARSVVPDPAAQACARCHPREVEAWQSSQHANANRLVELQQDGPAFTPARSLWHLSFTTQMRQREGRLEIEQTGPDGKRSTHFPEAAIGITPLVQYLVPFPGGRLQTVDVSYDPRSNEWFNAFGADNRQAHEWGFWKNRSMNWNTQCAFCHMTGFKKNYDPKTDAYASTWDAMGISCAQCHAVSNQSSVSSNQCPMVAPSNLASRISYLDSCASCHSRREQLTDGFKPGDRYHDHFRLVLADNPATFYPDGQIRDEDYEYNSFMTSRMGHKGIVCMDCHDPHSYKLRLPVENNALCLSCHLPPGQKGAIGIDPVQHGRHALTNAGSSCVECHMPHTTYMQRDPRRDHGFTSPDPQLTKELGIPNACTRCHADKTVDWSIDWARQWYGDKLEQRRARARARVIARAQRADATVVADLLALARSEEIASWRATLLTLLGPWAGQDRVRELLRESLTNDHPLIRSAAVNGLRGLPGTYDLLAPLRRDPVRLVRLDAAWATLNPIEREPASYAALIAYLNNACDQPAGAIRQGQKALIENQSAEAEAWMRKAAAWDPSAVPQHLLGQVLHQNGKPAEAETLFRKAAAYDPSNPEYPYTLALFYSELNRLEEARAQLQKAVELDPGFGRAWYNLGLAYAGQDQLSEARAALARAESLLPDSPDAPYALATVLARANDTAGARAAAQRALVLSPAHGPARQLLLSLSAPPPP